MVKKTNKAAKLINLLQKKFPVNDKKAILIPKSVINNKKQASGFAAYCAKRIRNEKGWQEYAYTTRTVLNEAKEYVGLHIYRLN